MSGNLTKVSVSWILQVRRAPSSDTHENEFDPRSLQMQVCAETRVSFCCTAPQSTAVPVAPQGSTGAVASHSPSSRYGPIAASMRLASLPAEDEDPAGNNSDCDDGDPNAMTVVLGDAWLKTVKSGDAPQGATVLAPSPTRSEPT